MSGIDINDWRTRTVSCAKKLNDDRTLRTSRELAHDLVLFLQPVGLQNSTGKKEAEDAMLGICDTAFDIAIMFRINSVPHTWLQRISITSLEQTDYEVIGSSNPNHSAEQCRPRKIIFGGAVKYAESEEDRIVLTKSEVLVG